MNNTDKVFVATYGSLRREMENFRVNGNAGGEFLSTATSVKKIPLYRFNNAYFPSISLSPSHVKESTPVLHVDIFTCEEQGLTGPYDCLEGYPDFYNRSVEDFVLNKDCKVGDTSYYAGDVIQAWVYHIDEEMDEPVESGDWCVYQCGANYYNNLNM